MSLEAGMCLRSRWEGCPATSATGGYARGTARGWEREEMPIAHTSQCFPVHKGFPCVISLEPRGGMMTVACFTEEDMESGARQVLYPSLEVHQQQIPGSNLGPQPLHLHFCPLEAHSARSG